MRNRNNNHWKEEEKEEENAVWNSGYEYVDESFVVLFLSFYVMYPLSGCNESLAVDEERGGSKDGRKRGRKEGGEGVG